METWSGRWSDSEVGVVPLHGKAGINSLSAWMASVKLATLGFGLCSCTPMSTTGSPSGANSVSLISMPFAGGNSNRT